MSRIKDLLAEAEGADDLKPVTKHIKVRTYAEQLADIVFKMTDYEETQRFIRNGALYSADEEDWYIENFVGLCKSVATDNLDKYIEDQHLDLSDATYNEVIERAGDLLADRLADFESDLIAEAKEDDKYKLDELRERNGEC